MEIGNNLTPPQQAFGQYNNPDNTAISKKTTAETAKNQATNQTANKAANNPVQQQRTQQEIQRLKTGEQRVIAHEMAHKSVGGQYAGAVSFEYKKGPDGKMYIVGGEVSIDVSNAREPKETVQKMEQVQRAALAPVDPSPQDRAVASAAAAKQRAAQQELLKKNLQTYETGKAPDTPVIQKAPKISVYA